MIEALTIIIGFNAPALLDIRPFEVAIGRQWQAGIRYDALMQHEQVSYDSRRANRLHPFFTRADANCLEPLPPSATRPLTCR